MKVYMSDNLQSEWVGENREMAPMNICSLFCQAYLTAVSHAYAKYARAMFSAPYGYHLVLK